MHNPDLAAPEDLSDEAGHRMSVMISPEAGRSWERLTLQGRWGRREKQD